ncbi:MAG: hypothetical protein ABMB14_15525 [Myxococcota bacterium]
MSVLRVASLGVLSVGCADPLAAAPGPCETWSMVPSFLGDDAIPESIEERLTVDLDGRPQRYEHPSDGAVPTSTTWTWDDGVLVAATSDTLPYIVTYLRSTSEASICDVSETVTAPTAWRALLVDWLADQPPLWQVTTYDDSSYATGWYTYEDSPSRRLTAVDGDTHDAFTYVGDLVYSSGGAVARSFDDGCNQTLRVDDGQGVVRTEVVDHDGARRLSGETTDVADARTRTVSWSYDEHGELATAEIDADGDGTVDEIDRYRCAVRF